MSMYSAPFTSAARNRYARTLAEAVCERRIELGLSLVEAAELAGLSLWYWAALEHALWIPDDGPQMRAIADTLQGDCTAVSFLAAVSRCNQSPVPRQ